MVASVHNTDVLCTGISGTHAMMVAYADSVDDLYSMWPLLVDIEYTQAGKYVFSDRFPMPEWFQLLLEEEQ